MKISYAITVCDELEEIKRFELCNYDFKAMTDPALKKKLGLI